MVDRRTGDCTCLVRAPPVFAPFYLTHCTQDRQRETYLCQHGLGILEVAQHSFDISLIGRPRQETPGEALHALHRVGWQQQQLPAMLRLRVRLSRNAQETKL